MDEDIPLAQVSSLPMENCFHPLSYTDGEGDAQRMAATLPPLIVSTLPALIR